MPPIIERHPALARLMRGPHTLDARTDADMTVTLPNHVSMLTGLAANEHAWLRNDDPPGLRQGGTIHDRAGRYIPSAFDVAHDHGVSTALFTGKSKFWLFEQSYGRARGEKDETGDDEGKAKLDLFVHAIDSETLVDQFVARLARAAELGTRTLDLVHFAETDIAGHAAEWDLTTGSVYLGAMSKVDAWLGRILETIDRNDSLRGRVAFVLTTDHGGGDPAKTHTNAEAPINFTIPLLVWLGQDTAAIDLYAINPATRVRPRKDENPAADADPPPLRNGEVGNLALQILGLPAIPGSRYGGRHDLQLQLPAPFPAAPQAMPRSSARSVEDRTEQRWNPQHSVTK